MSTQENFCQICGGRLDSPHEHQPDQSGLDDGPWLPGRGPRKKPEPKSSGEMADIRRRAWETRRAKYGNYGHRWGTMSTLRCDEPGAIDEVVVIEAETTGAKAT